MQTNSDLPNATPSPDFPAYPSGHAVIGTAAFTAIRRELAIPDTFTFTFTSAELDGVARNAGVDGILSGTPRPRVTRTLNIDSAIQQNLNGRKFLGVHWEFDSSQGGFLGTEVRHLATTDDESPCRSFQGLA